MNIIAAALAGAASLALFAGQPPKDDATEVSGVTALADFNRIPVTGAEFEALSRQWKVPHYSAEQAASFVCMARHGAWYNVQAAELALKATEAFEAVKVRVREGKATIAELVAADTQRQVAVGNLLQPPVEALPRDRASFSGRAQLAMRNYQGSTMGPPPRISYLLPSRLDLPNGLTVERTEFRIETRTGDQALMVKATFRNTGKKIVQPKRITIAALDRKGLTLADQAYELNGPALKPGETGDAEFVFANMPFYTHDIRVHFGPSGGVRNDRTCTVMERFHPPEGIKLDLAAKDDVQNRLDAIPVR